MSFVSHTIHNNTFWLSSHRTVYWEQQQALIVSDLHFGKTGHFRKHGIAVPQQVYKEDLQRLFSEIQHYNVQQVIIVGDMFHSQANKEIDLFNRWRHDLPQVTFHLIKGNHDILPQDMYHESGLVVHEKELVIGDFIFTHDYCEEVVTNAYVFSGHIHPAIHISGLGKQSLSFPCFYFGRQCAVLPAFSKFTGTALISPKTNEKVFAIVNQSVISVN